MTHDQGFARSAPEKTRLDSPVPEQLGNLCERLAEGDLATVTVLGPAHDVGWKAHPVPASRFLAATRAHNAVVLQTAAGEHSRPSHAAPFETGHLAVDLSTLRVATWSPGTAVALADVCTSEGRVQPSSPRHVLESLTTRLEAHGLRVTIAVQSQLRLADTTNPDAESDFDAVLVHLCSLLYQADLPVESISTVPSTHAPDPSGQLVTATFAPRDPLTACDNHVLHHLAAAVHSERHGLRTGFSSTDRLTLRFSLTAPDQTADALIDMAFAGLRGELGNVAASRIGMAPFPVQIAGPHDLTRNVTDPVGAVAAKNNPETGVITLEVPAATGIHEAIDRQEQPCRAGPSDGTGSAGRHRGCQPRPGRRLAAGVQARRRRVGRSALARAAGLGSARPARRGPCGTLNRRVRGLGRRSALRSVHGYPDRRSLGVRAGDINREEWTWSVCRQTTPGPSGLIDKGTKGKRRRTVPIIPEIRPMVARRLDAAGRDPMARLFTGPRGGRISTAVLRDATHWDDVVARLGYEHLRRHDLRHTGLTWMADAGVPIHVLRKIAGHGSLATTQRYLHPNRRSIDLAGAALSAHLSGGKDRLPDDPRGRAWSQSGPNGTAETAPARGPLSRSTDTKKPAELERYAPSAGFVHRRDDRI